MSVCLGEELSKRGLFQVFINPNGTDEVALPPVVSNEIVDKKAHCDLEIVKLSVLTSPVTGKIKRQKVAFVAQGYSTRLIIQLSRVLFPWALGFFLSSFPF